MPKMTAFIFLAQKDSIKAILNLNAVHKGTEKLKVMRSRCMNCREVFDRFKLRLCSFILTGSSLVLVAVCRKG